jgi:hypothetical protein
VAETNLDRRETIGDGVPRVEHDEREAELM